MSTTDLTQLRRGVLPHCVLALLEHNDVYGYDLVTRLGEAGLVTSEGTVYPLLSRLRKENLVTTTWQESPSGPPRRYYRISNDGRRALAGFRAAWTDFSRSIDTILSPPPSEKHR